MHVPQTEIIITHGGVEAGRRIVTPGEYILGGATDCEITIEAEGVSRRHAKLTINYHDTFIEDLGSSNGTFVNDRRVSDYLRLWPNQKVQLGCATVELRRLKAAGEDSLAPATRTVRRVLPEEFLRARKYEIGGVVAQGGMGAILDAKEATIERRVAMKVMLDSGSSEDLLRFIAEAKITGQLEHPGIVPVYELGVDEHEQVFYTMKFVGGITLGKVFELLAAGAEGTVKKYPLPALLTVFQKVCDALAFAHSHGVIHRDLKPENIMLGDFGEVLVMDWGLAKVLGAPETVAPAARMKVSTVAAETESASLTMVGTILGTPHYMSPEQARGEVEQLDVRTDIYALGAILHHLLTLHPPVEGKDAEEVVARVSEGRLLSPQQALATHPHWRLPHLPGSRVPASLEAVVRKAMALRREDRYPVTAALQADLMAYQNGFATGAENASPWKLASLFIRRNRTVAAGLAVVFLLANALALNMYLGEKKVRATLAELRATAPIMQAEVLQHVRDHDFPQALERLTYLNRLVPEKAEFFALKGNMLETLLRFPEARAAYARAAELAPETAFVNENMALCQRLSGREATPAVLSELRTAMNAQGRFDEENAVLGHLGQNSKETLAHCLEVFRKANVPADLISKVWMNPDGTLEAKLDGQDAAAIPLKGLPFRGLSLRGAKVGDLNFVRGMPLETLDLSHSDVEELGALKGIPLKNLDLNETKISDLSPLASSPLQELHASDSKVTNLAPLHGMPLHVLTLAHTAVRDLSSLQGAPLEKLDCDMTGVKDLTPLTGAPLAELNVNGTRVTNLEPLHGMRLTNLSAGGTKIASLAPLAGMPLSWLDLHATQITDLSPLHGMPLSYLSIGNCLGVQDLTPLKGVPLVNLRCYVTRVGDLSPLAGMRLRQLSASGSKVHDLGPLKGMRSLVALDVAETNVTELSPLQGLALESLYLEKDAVRDLSPLKGMPLRALWCAGCQGLTDLHPLENCLPLEELTFPAECQDFEFLRRLPKLARLSSHVVISRGVGIDKVPAATDFWKEDEARKKAAAK